MVLHIPRPSEGVLVPRLDPSELTEDLLHGLTHHIGQHIEATCMPQLLLQFGAFPEVCFDTSRRDSRPNKQSKLAMIASLARLSLLPTRTSQVPM